MTRRTIRVSLGGRRGSRPVRGKAYHAAHGKEKHALAMESDFGIDRIWRIDFKLPESTSGLAYRLAADVAPLDIGREKQPMNGTADIESLAESGVSGIDLQQDGTRYFDLHHSFDNALDKVDPAQLSQNVAAWTTVLSVIVNTPGTLGTE